MYGHNKGANNEEKRQSFGDKIKEGGSKAGENLSQTIKHYTNIMGNKAKSMARQVSSGIDKTSDEIHHIGENIDSVKKSLGGANSMQAKVNAGSAFYETKNSIEHTGSQMMKDSQRQGSKLMNSGNNDKKM